MRRTFKVKHLPTKLLAVREHLGLSQSQLAAKLRLNLHYSRLSEFERGRRIPNLITLLDYARLAGIHVDDLIDDETEMRL